MKKLLLSVVLLMLAIGMAAQDVSYLLPDQRVEPPVFKGKEIQKKVETRQSPICCYLEENLNVPPLDYFPEGILCVEFTVNATGKLTNFKVINDLNYQLENAVISCIKKTEGQWQPGTVNGNPSQMEKRVYVKFDIPGNPSFNDLTKEHYFSAIKYFNKGMFIKEDVLLDEEKKERKSSRFFEKSLSQLDLATRYSPNSAALAYWKACNFEQLNNTLEMYEKLDQYEKLLSMNQNEQELEDYYNLALISK